MELLAPRLHFLLCPGLASEHDIRGKVNLILRMVLKLQIGCCAWDEYFLIFMGIQNDAPISVCFHVLKIPEKIVTINDHCQQTRCKMNRAFNDLPLKRVKRFGAHDAYISLRCQYEMHLENQVFLFMVSIFPIQNGFIPKAVK